MHKAAGGPLSRQVVQKNVRTGAGSFAKSVKGVSQIGTSVGNHVTGKGKIFRNTQRDIGAGRGYTAGGAFGNEIALNVGRGAPGAGRTLHGQSGSQAQYGLVAGVRRTPSKSFDD